MSVSPKVRNDSDSDPDIIDIEPCPVLLPSLVALLPALREGMRDVLRNGERGDLYVAQLDGGADALLTDRKSTRLNSSH